MVKLTFYGGAGEIGGNKILLEDKDTRVFLDFGVSFTFGCEYFSGYLQPRSVNGLGDYFEFNLLPKLKGLYAKQLLQNTGLKYEKPHFDGVVLSHAHIDHVGHVDFIDENIPLYCGETTKVILDALRESGGYDYGEHRCRTFRTGRIVKIGNLEVEPIHVDHSIPAAYGFIIHSSKGAVVYTGDLRLHGPMSKMTMEFIDRAQRSDPIAVISEGTRINPAETRTTYSEEDVKRLSDRIVKRINRLAVCAFYGRDIDRFNTFYEVARKNDRNFVISTKAAYLLSKLKDDPKLKVPDISKDPNISVYKKRKRTGRFEESDYYHWERPFIGNAVTYTYIQKNQSKILLNLDLTGFAELIDIKPDAGGHFIHSMSEPFSEEDLQTEVMHNWLNHFGLRFHQIHASGHCQSQELRNIIDTIKPRMLFPVHTESPELFEKIIGKDTKIIPPQRKLVYTL